MKMFENADPQVLEAERMRKRENARKMTVWAGASIVVFLIYAGLLYAEALFFGGSMRAAHLTALAGGVPAVCVIILILKFPQAVRTPIYIAVMTQLIFIAMGSYLQELEFYFFVTLLLVGTVSIMKNFRLMAVCIAVMTAINILGMIFYFPRLHWMPHFRFFMQFMMFLYGSVFMLFQTYAVQRREDSSERAFTAFTALLRTTPNSMVITNSKCQVRYISDAMAKFVNCPRKEFAVGQPFIDLVANRGLKMMFADILDSDGYYEAVMPIDMEGEEKYFKVVSDKLPGEIGGLFIDISDITPMVKSQMAAEEAQIMAVEASEAKSKFLATMSHEIRTPMNAIVGMTELTLREELPPAVREQTSTVKQAANNLLSLINDILDLSKIESGKLEIVPTDYYLSSIVNDVATIIKMRVMESEVRFSAKVNGEIPDALIGDEVRIRQIFLNILSNAVKYTPKGFILFGLSGEVIDDDTILLTIDVTDTGKGIKEEDIEKLFGDFVQVDLAANRGIEGTGLGLSITKSLIKAMGGDISVRSEYGRGSTFTVTLPQKIRSREPMSLDMSDRLSYGANRNPGPTFSAPGARALVVDDIDTNLKVAAGLMAPYRILLDTCLSGKDAIDAVKANRYDVVFMDHMMPEMDGIEATKRIRELRGEHPHLRDLPIIALTANAVSGMKEMFLQNGFDDFLSKPIDIAKLNAVLKKWIPREMQEEAEIAAVNEGDPDAIKIEGVNTALGLSRIGGAIGNYLETLAVFCKDARERSEALEKALAADDTQSYVTHVHALKSASANIGAAEISDTAKALEAAGRRGDTAYIKARHIRFLAKLETLVQDISETVSAKKEKQAKAAVDAEALSKALTDLSAAIDTIDPDAINAAAKEIGRFKDAEEIGEKIEKILWNVLDGKYDEVASLVESLLRNNTGE